MVFPAAGRWTRDTPIATARFLPPTGTTQGALWVRPAEQARDMAAQSGWRWAALNASFVVLLMTAFPWVTGENGAESTIINAGKLALVLAAAGTSLLAGRGRQPLVGHLLLVAYGIVTALGAVTADAGLGAVVRSARLVLVVLVIGHLAVHIGERAVLRGIAVSSSASATVTVAAGAVGLAAPKVDGRLAGVLPPMHPNILASICMLGIVALTALWLEHGMPTRWLAFLPVLVTALVGTGSRTSLLTAALGISVMVLWTLSRGRQKVRAAGFVFCAVAVGFLVVVGTSEAALRATGAALLTRGGTSAIDPTLTGRTYVWAAAAAFNETTVEKTFGQGLDVKALPRWLGNVYELQGIDSTWYSAWVAGGAIGLTVLAAALLSWILAARNSAGALAVVLALAASSATESVLADVSFGLVAGLSITASAGAASRPRHATPAWGALSPDRLRTRSAVSPVPTWCSARAPSMTRRTDLAPDADLRWSRRRPARSSGR